MASPKLSVVVPVYRSQNTLEKLYVRIRDAVQSVDPDFELIFVEDCGGDDSWSVIERLAEADSRVHGIKMSRNFGQHAATICGIGRARGQWIVTLDDDLEHPPESIPNLYQKAQEGCDLVYGVYPVRSHKAWRNITSDIARWLFKKAIPSLNDNYTSFRCIRKEVASVLETFDSPFPFVDGYLSWITGDFDIVEVEHSNRDTGHSNYSFGKLVTHTLNIFVTFSGMPLKMASWIGLIFFLFGMIFLSVIFIGKLAGSITAIGFPSIMGGIVLFGGIQLLILGVLGEYMGRISSLVSKKPLYIVSRETGGDYS
jgi:undecaprenyl-phosphate 4-deoxy-4-formamido-L-arabinose transferase